MASLPQTDAATRMPNGDVPDSQSFSAEQLLVSAEVDQTPALSVVMPTLNEEDGIGTCIDWIKKAIGKVRRKHIVMDDAKEGCISAIKPVSRSKEGSSSLSSSEQIQSVDRLPAMGVN